jgi:RNA polymerase subunit RPABC4/transcription elongation factor Spt4
MATCNKCGNVLKPGAKFCTKCGSPVTASADKQMSSSGDFCPQCKKPLKPGAKFCTLCGAKILQHGTVQSDSVQAEQKGWFTDGVRAVANALTGGQLNRDIAREQNAAISQQENQARTQIREAQQAQQTTEQALIRAEREAERGLHRSGGNLAD